MLLVFFLLVMSFTVSRASEKYVCTLNHTVEMESDTIYFFESPDFPRYMTLVEKVFCFTKFQKHLSVEEQDKKFVIFFSSVSCKYDCEYFDEFFLLNFTSYNFDGMVYNYDAFRGYVYLDDWGDDCPLESVSRINPFQFTDLDQVLSLRSTYSPSDQRRQSCLWQFMAPQNYGFKIVVRYLDILNSTVFKVETSQDIIVTNANVRVFQPHYSIDNYLKVYLSENNRPLSANEEYDMFEFEAYITIVQYYHSNIPFNCFYTDSKSPSSITYWSYWNDKGYPSNARCNHTLKIAPKTEVIATFENIETELNVDVVNYYYPSNKLPNIYGGIEHAFAFSTVDDKETEILLEFVSDGSIQLRGFNMSLHPIYCKCSNNSTILVPCIDGIDAYIMDNADDIYCGNLKCTFIVKLDPSCTSHFIDLSIYLEFVNEYDVLKIISNNTTLYEINRENGEENSYDILIPSANDNIFQVFTASSTMVRRLRLNFAALNISATLMPVIINETKPYYLHQHFKYNDNIPYMLSIELSPSLKRRNATIVIFCTVNLHGFTFYNEKNLSDQLDLQNCFSEVTDDVFKCKTNVNSLSMVAYVIDYYSEYIIFQAITGDNLIGSEGCVFKKNNAFNLVKINPDERIISAISNGKQKCRIFCYASDSFFISKMWSSSKSNSSLSIYSGVDEKLFQTFNITSLFLWRNLFLTENIYIIDIPLNTALTITTFHKNFSVNRDYGAINITNDPYKSIIASPNYGNNAVIPYSDSDDGCNGKARDFEIFETSVKFTVLNFDVSGSNYFYFIVNEIQHINITSSHQSFVFEPSHIEFGCFCSSNLGCNIRILVETIDFNDLTTTPLNKATTYAILSTKKELTTEKSVSSIATINYMLLIFVIIYLFK